MSEQFFDRPILSSPYEYPERHWDVDGGSRSTDRILDRRRDISFVTSPPGPRKGRGMQQAVVFDEAAQRAATDGQEYKLAQTINSVRDTVDRWRALRDPEQWRVTPETARMLHHWRHHRFNDIRPFFRQVEAVIRLIEIAPCLDNAGRRFLDHLERANEDPGLAQLALKLATGVGKTTVIAMLIAWKTINTVRRPTNRWFTHGFLAVTPSITIRDRLRVLQPNNPDADYRSRRLVPGDMLGDLERAKVVITNFHAFKLRETMVVSKGGRALLQGRGPDLHSLESEGQMLQSVMPELMEMKDVLAPTMRRTTATGRSPARTTKATFKSTGRGNLFLIFGEPDIDILTGDGDTIQVRINGVDVYHPNTGEVRTHHANGIACWFVDTDYNEESFFVRHASFLGTNDPYKALRTMLKAEIGPDGWAALNSDTSRPFPRPASGRIAVKGHQPSWRRGDEGVPGVRRSTKHPGRSDG